MDLSKLSPLEQLKLWLEAVHVDAGFTCCARSIEGQPKGQPWQHQFFPTLPELARHIWRSENHSNPSFNVYVTPACFDQKQRLKHHVHSVRALWLDVDIENNTEHYHSAVEAHDALTKILNEEKYPLPNLMVMTGHGLQYLWTMTSAVGPDTWHRKMRYLSDMLKGRYKYDAGVTVDIARVLRPSGLTNRKVIGQPVPTRLAIYRPGIDPALLPDAVASASIQLGGLTAGVQPFGALPPPSSRAYQANASPAALTATAHLTAIPANTNGAMEPVDILLVLQTCPLLAKIAESHGAYLTTEWQWRACLQLASFCKDPELWAHRLVDGHPHYDPQQTQQKYLQVLHSKMQNQGLGPHRCEELERSFALPVAGLPGPWQAVEPARMTSPCATCVYRSCNTTPLATPFRYVTLAPSIVTRTMAGHLGLYLERHTEAGVEREFITDWGIHSYELAEAPGNESEGSVLSITALVSGQHKLTAHLDMNKLHTPQETGRAVQHEGLTAPIGPPRGLLHRALGAMRDHRRTTGPDAVIWKRMGWSHMVDVFALGDHVWYPGGKKQKLMVRDEDARRLQEQYTRHGDPITWQREASLFLSDPRPEAHALLASSFASILAKPAGYNFLSSFVSEASGVGKSTLMRVAASVWGAPGTVHSGGDTTTALQGRLRIAHSIPVFWDEFARSVVERQLDVVPFLFRHTQGTEKARGTVTGSLQASGEWANSLLISGNFPLLRLMDQSNNDEAGFARILEFIMPEIVDDAVVKADMSVFSYNFGWGGLLALIYFLNHRKAVIDFMQAEYSRLEAAHGPEPRNRFIYWNGAATITGAELAHQSRTLTIDTDKVRQAVAAAIVHVLGVITTAKSASLGGGELDRLNRYVEVMSPYWVTVASANNTIPPRSANAPPAGETDHASGTTMISLNQLRSYLRKVGHNPAIDIMNLQRLQGVTVGRRMIGAGVPMLHGKTQDVLIVPNNIIGK